MSLLEEYLKSGGNTDAPDSPLFWFIEQAVPVYAFRTEKPTLDVGIPPDIETAAHFDSSTNKEDD